MKSILKLKPWALLDVLLDKYEWEPCQAQGFVDFLLPMLALDPSERSSAEDCLRHPFLKEAPL